MELRTWLSQELKSRNWSGRELARKTGLSPSLVTKTLSGERGPSADFCVKVAEALGEAPEKLLRMAEILPPASEDKVLAELLDLLRNMSADQKKEMLRYAKYVYQSAAPLD